jgi:hypothetical protein
MKNRSGTIITFYSYKGGVGRSMAVANIGRLLARDPSNAKSRTLLIDWDLEAPGLTEYFKMGQPERGLIEYFHDIYGFLKKQPASPPESLTEFSTVLQHALPIERYLCEIDESMTVMAAGRCENGYAGKYQQLVASFDWVGLYREYPFAIQAFRRILRSRFRNILIDSRTGISDISGLCTALLPDKLVAMFGPNRQNRRILDIVEASLEFRRMSPDLDPLIVFPLASRFDSADLYEFQSSLNSFRDGFSEMFKRAYGLKNCNLEAYFRDNVLLYVPRYSYNETRVVVDIEEPDYMGSLRRGYEEFAKWLSSRQVPWVND